MNNLNSLKKVNVQCTDNKCTNVFPDANDEDEKVFTFGEQGEELSRWGQWASQLPLQQGSPRLGQEEQQQELEEPRGGLRRDREDRVQGEASGMMGLEERVRDHCQFNVCWLFCIYI